MDNAKAIYYPGVWKSKAEINKDYLNSPALKRQINEKTKVVFMIDGFPKQGNTSLRSILLFIFPEIAIPLPLVHSIDIMAEAISDKDILLCPIRNPYEVISSCIGMTTGDGIKVIKNNINDSFHTHHINAYIRMMAFILENKDSILIIKYEDILKMCLDFENNDIKNNSIIDYLQDRFDLFLDTGMNITAASVKNRSHRSVTTEKILHLPMYRHEMEKAVNLYNQAYQHSLDV